MHEIARALPDDDPIRHYFEQFLPTLYGRLLIPDLESLSTCFAIAVTDVDAAPWRIEIQAGRLVRAGHDGAAPLCTFRLDGATLLEVVAARLVPAEAFFAKRIDLDGDMELGLKLSTDRSPMNEAAP